MKLSASSIKTWANLERLFLAHSFEDDTEISVPTLLQPSKRKKSPLKFSLKDFGAWHSVVPEA